MRWRCDDLARTQQSIVNAEVIHAIFSQGEHSCRSREWGREGGKARHNYPIHTGGFEARGRVFTDDNGQRTAFLFLEMQDASLIPAIAEPWFLAFNASIEIHPVMVPDDLAKAGSAIEQAVKKYG
jgi:hypothetical protein